MAKGETIVIKKKKGGGHGGHHGGAWKVAYADFVTAMMAFFMVMWLMGADEETKSAISHYFNNPSSSFKGGGDPDSDAANPLGEKQGDGESILKGMEGQFSQDLIDRPLPVKSMMREAKSISRMLEDLLDGKIHGMDINDHRMKFSMSERVLFNPGSAELTAEAKSNLDVLGQLLKGFSGFLTIQGHADETVLRGTKYKNNWELSMGRALAVMEYLVKVHKLDEERLLPVGAGPKRAISSATKGRKDTVEKSRSVEFVLSYEDPQSNE